jgi:mRNA interferase RelE/StbE
MNAEFTSRFLKDTRQLRSTLKEELEKAIKKVIENPEIGKPLRYSYRNCRSVRVGKFRIIYKLEGYKIIFITFEHRGKVYR